MKITNIAKVAKKMQAAGLHLIGNAGTAKFCAEWIKDGHI